MSVSELLLSFAAAFEHIPQQQQLKLFSRLAYTLGAGDALFAILAILADRYPTNQHVDEFMAELINEFDPVTGLEVGPLTTIWELD
jgi:U3 small nucleolar RNA-associated protein 10